MTQRKISSIPDNQLALFDVARTNEVANANKQLSNYLASQATGLGLGGSDNNNDADNTLGRLIRMGGGTTGGGRDGGGPGIDIHIHAVVTGPGVSNISGLGGIGGTTTTTTAATPLPSILRNGNSSVVNRAMSPPRAVAEPPRYQEDMDLFSELYSESPTPLNMHGSGTSGSAEEETGGNDLGQVFEECRSIEEEDDSCATNELDVTGLDLAAVATTYVEEVALDSSHDDADDAVPKSTVETSLQQNEDGKTNNNNLCTRPSQAVTSSLSNNYVENNSNGSIHTISEIGSTSSSPPSPTPQIDSLSTQSSTSFTNRLYRRTFGRLGSNSNRRASNSP